jgi:hypothetical protein
VLCEIAIAACDLAEVIGAAIALNLLFGLPLIWGVCITALDVLVVLYLQNKGFRYVEALVVGPDCRHRGVLCRGVGAVAPLDVRRGGGVRPELADSSRPRDALHRRRHPGRDGDAPQPVSALVDRADPEVPRHAAEQARSDPLSRRSIRRSR